MLPDKPWRFDIVLPLVACLMISIGVGAVVGQSLHLVLPSTAKDLDSFLRFLVSTLSFQGVALVLIHILLRLHAVTWRELLGFDTPQWPRALKIGAVAGLLVVPFALIFNWASYELLRLITNVEPERQMVVTIVEQNAAWYQRLCFGITAILLAPLVEEILFRGVLYPMLKPHNGWVKAMLASAFFFAVIHLNLMTFFPLFLLAILLTLLYERTGALLAPIVAHLIFNGINFALLISTPQLEGLLKYVQKLMGAMVVLVADAMLANPLPGGSL